jgi:uncharacterized protein with HEPN domain
MAKLSAADRIMVGMRNRLVHAYFDIERQIVWDTVRTALPPLLESLRLALRADAPRGPGAESE